MPVSKLKNLALLILLLANVLLVAILVPTRTALNQDAEQMRQSLQQLCAEQQITLSTDAIPDTVTLYALELAEDSRANLQAATALLGEQVLIQDDSTRYLRLYSAQTGTCQMGRNGSFQSTLSGREADRDLTRAARKTLKAMGFQTHSLSADGETVTARQAILGMPVFSEGLRLQWTDNRLTDLGGTFYTGTMSRVSDSPSLSAADALIAFLSARFELGWIGSSVTAMEQGYLRSETAAAAVVRLTPVWILHTDTGDFCVDGLSGQVTVME